MLSNIKIPNQVVIHAIGPSTSGLCVRLCFEMSRKNSYSYMVFLDSEGTATVSNAELLQSFDEERRAFIMDYEDPRVAFTGNITAKVLNTAELKAALEAFHMFRGELSFPDNYEARLHEALQREQGPDKYQLEVQTAQ